MWGTKEIGGSNELATFLVLGDSGYAKDKYRVYFNDQVIYAADTDIFVVLDPTRSMIGPTKIGSTTFARGFAKDKFLAYYNGKLIYGSDGDSFGLKSDSPNPVGECKFIAVDKNGCYSTCESSKDSNGRSCILIPQPEPKFYTDVRGRFTIDLDGNYWKQYGGYYGDMPAAFMANQWSDELHINISSSSSNLSDSVDDYIKNLSIFTEYRDFKVISRQPVILSGKMLSVLMLRLSIKITQLNVDYIHF